jgi:hypothetical protein
MDRGYIKLWRKIDEWEWRSNPNTFSLFMYLLTKATYRITKYKGYDLVPGQAIFGLNQARKDLNISIRSLRTGLSRLKSTDEITIKSTNKFSIITLNNYSSYQSNENKNDSQSNKQTDIQPTIKRQATDNIQEVKKVISKEINPGFERWYSKYPRKEAKQDALKAFLKLNPNDELLERMLSAVVNKSKTEQWIKDDGKFIPLPATWIRGRRWEDEINTKTNGVKTEKYFPMKEYYPDKVVTE